MSLPPATLSTSEGKIPRLIFFFSFLSVPGLSHRTHGYNATSGPRLPSVSWKLRHVLVHYFYGICFLCLIHSGRAILSTPDHYYAISQILFLCSFWNYNCQFSQSWEHFKALKSWNDRSWDKGQLSQNDTYDRQTTDPDTVNHTQGHRWFKWKPKNASQISTW